MSADLPIARHCAIAAAAAATAASGAGNTMVPFKVIGGEELMEEPRFCTPTNRESNIDDLRLEIQKRFTRFNCADAISCLEAVGVPVARVRTLPEAIEDTHFRDRGTLKPMRRHGSEEPIEVGIISGFPIEFSGGALPQLEGGAPLGHHNTEIYSSLLDLDGVKLNELKKRGVI